METVTILSLLVTAAVVVQGVRNRPGGAQIEAKDSAASLPPTWSKILVGTAIIYCLLLLAGLYYTGWFRID